MAYKIKNLDERLKFIKEHPTTYKQEVNKQRRESNKSARELGYARGVKQMKEEGAL